MTSFGERSQEPICLVLNNQNQDPVNPPVGTTQESSSSDILTLSQLQNRMTGVTLKLILLNRWRIASETDTNFLGEYWSHFNDPDPCGKHSVVGDHYHIVFTKQIPENPDTAAYTPCSSAIGCWLRRQTKPELEGGRGLQLPPGQSIFKPG